MLADPGWIEKEESMWPQVREKIYFNRKISFKADTALKPFFFPKWRWAVVGLFLVFVVGAVLMIQTNFQKKSAEPEVLVKETPRITIEHAEKDGKKARAYIYQTPEISFIWFSEAKNNGG